MDNSINLRKVQEKDCEILFKWANDKLVRENAFNSEGINYDTHKKWFEKKIKDDNTEIFIVLADDEMIGQIRIDLDNGKGLIDYSIESSYRGKGYGTEILKKIVDMVKDQGLSIDKLIGKVKHDNIPSQKAFEKAGYSKEIRSEYIEYTKLLIDRD